MSIPCILCDRRYSLELVGTELFISTGVCIHCYRAGARADRLRWCFAKQYDAKTPECLSVCPDRQFCRMFVKGDLK